MRIKSPSLPVMLAIPVTEVKAIIRDLKSACNLFADLPFSSYTDESVLQFRVRLSSVIKRLQTELDSNDEIQDISGDDDDNYNNDNNNDNNNYYFIQDPFPDVFDDVDNANPKLPSTSTETTSSSLLSCFERSSSSSSSSSDFDLVDKVEREGPLKVSFPEIFLGASGPKEEVATDGLRGSHLDNALTESGNERPETRGSVECELKDDSDARGESPHRDDSPTSGSDRRGSIDWGNDRRSYYEKTRALLAESNVAKGVDSDLKIGMTSEPASETNHLPDRCPVCLLFKENSLSMTQFASNQPETKTDDSPPKTSLTAKSSSTPFLPPRFSFRSFSPTLVTIFLRVGRTSYDEKDVKQQIWDLRVHAERLSFTTSAIIFDVTYLNARKLMKSWPGLVIPDRTVRPELAYRTQVVSVRPEWPDGRPVGVHDLPNLLWEETSPDTGLVYVSPNSCMYFVDLEAAKRFSEMGPSVVRDRRVIWKLQVSMAKLEREKRLGLFPAGYVIESDESTSDNVGSDRIEAVLTHLGLHVFTVYPNSRRKGNVFFRDRDSVGRFVRGDFPGSDEPFRVVADVSRFKGFYERKSVKFDF